MVEKIVYHGLTSEQTEKLSEEAFVKSVKSRSRRSLKRNSYKYKALVEKALLLKPKQKVVKTHLREAVIRPEWIGMTFGVHNGKEFQSLQINASMIGHRLGEYAYTTKRVVHSAPGIKATKGSRSLGEK